MSQNSYLHHFNAQVTQIVIFAYLTVFTAFYNCMTWNVRKLISPPFQCTSITNRVLRLFDHFTVYYNCMTWNVRKLISPPLQSTSIRNRFLSLFDHFTAYYNCMTWNVTKLISPPFQCTSITNRVLRLFDPFTAFYNCMTWIVRKLISPPFQCTSITNRVLRLFDQFYGLLQLYDLKCQKTHISAISVHKYLQIVFIAYLTVLRLITTVWPEMSENSYLRLFSAQVSQIVFLANLTVFTTLLQLYDLKCQKTHISVISVNKYHKSCF